MITVPKAFHSPASVFSWNLGPSKTTCSYSPPERLHFDPSARYPHAASLNVSLEDDDERVSDRRRIAALDRRRKNRCLRRIPENQNGPRLGNGRSDGAALSPRPIGRLLFLHVALLQEACEGPRRADESGGVTTREQ